MSSSSIVGGNCPSGGTWYACSSGTYFVGCCARDPCTITCASGSLYPAGFNPRSFEKFPDASCGTGSEFYTCNSGNTFLGCCKTNACQAPGSVCPKSDLEPSFLSRDDQRAAYGAAVSSSLAGSSITSTSRPANTLSTTTLTASATATKDSVDPVPQSNGPPVGAIAGGAVGGTVALAVIAGLLIYYFCHAKKSRKGHDDTIARRESDIPAMAVAHDSTKGTYPNDAPPGYASPTLNYPAQHYNYAHQHTQHHTVPQELSAEPQSSAMYTHKPVVSHQRNVSELSGDTAIRSELESAYTTPKVRQTSSPAVQMPHEGNVVGNEHDTISPVTGTWSAHKNWQTPSLVSDTPRPAQGLGLQGSDELHFQQGNPSHSGTRGYPGV